MGKSCREDEKSRDKNLSTSEQFLIAFTRIAAS